MYYFVQNFPRYKCHVIYGKPIDHPDVLDFIGRVKGGFGIHLLAAVKWVESGRSEVVRYEDLHADAHESLRKLSQAIQPVDGESIRQAIQVCSVQNMRKKSNTLKRHIRKATVGDWRNHLTEAHLDVFRVHADMIERIGYPVE